MESSKSLRKMEKEEVIEKYNTLRLQYQKALFKLRGKVEELAKRVRIQKDLKEQQKALREIVLYLENIMFWQELSDRAKLVFRYIIDCRYYMRHKKMFNINPNVEDQLAYLKAELLNEEERNVIRDYILGKFPVARKWNAEEDKILKDSTSSLEVAYRTGRSLDSIYSRRRHLGWKISKR